MLDGLRTRYDAARRRLRRFERREIREFRRWIEYTANLVHLSVLVFVPVLIAAVTALSNAVDLLPFVLFPPLASGTYTLFADPKGEYASPTRFVAGLTAGAVCGTAAIWLGLRLGLRSPFGTAPLVVSPAEAALAAFLTGAVTWGLDFEEPAAFSTALLALVAPAFGDPPTVAAFLVQYAGSVFVASAIVAAAFSAWRREFYERRSQFLYASTDGDDHVLVPMRGDRASATATFAARLAAAHDAGKVVLLDVVDEARGNVAEDTGSGDDAAGDDVIGDAGADDGSGGDAGPNDDAVGDGDDAGDADGEEAAGAAADSTPASQATTVDDAVETLARESADRLEAEADRIETEVDVPCEVVVASGSTPPTKTVLAVADEADCDLVVAPYEGDDGGLSAFVRGLFRSDVDAIAFRSRPSADPRSRWQRVLVPVHRPGDTAHVMVDFARRVAGLAGSVSVCTCIDSEDERRRAEATLADLVETFEGSFETRVSRSSIESFLAANDDHYDLVVMGASTDRSAASRFVSPPTFERVHDLACDVAIVHRGE